jgi:hypothetical protein
MSSTEPLVLAPVIRLGTAAGALIAVNCAANLIAVWAAANLEHVTADYDAGAPGVGISDLVGADNVDAGMAVIASLSFVAAAGVFLLWLWQVRRNADTLAPFDHHLRRGWTIGGWFCPVVNLWFPYRVVADIWRASRPTDRPGHAPVLGLWWAVWVLSFVEIGMTGDEPRVSLMLGLTTTNTFAALLKCAAGVLVIMLIGQITQWQTAPRTRPV